MLEIAEAEEEALCSQSPLTYYNAVWPDLWIPSTDYYVGDMVRPPTQNNRIYVCVQDGTSGSVEPGWMTSQDEEFDDGFTRWITHLNYSLANVALAPADFTIEDNISPAGRKLVIAEKSGTTVHTGGTVTHTALISHTNKEVTLITEAGTSLAENDDVQQGLSTIFRSFEVPIYIEV